MNFDDYQTEAVRTMSRDKSPEMTKAVLALGLAGEAGEVVELLKKHLGHGHPLVRAQLEKELGDVLWYVAALAHEHNINLGVVAHANIMKLRARYPQGFSQERSLNREPECGECCPRDCPRCGE